MNINYNPKMDRKWLIHVINNYRKRNSEYILLAYELRLFKQTENINELPMDKLLELYIEEYDNMRYFHSMIKDIRNKEQIIADLKNKKK